MCVFVFFNKKFSLYFCKSKSTGVLLLIAELKKKKKCLVYFGYNTQKFLLKYGIV